MKNTFRRIAALLALAICLCGVAALVTACDDNDPATATTGSYTVIVTYPGGEKVDGNSGTGGVDDSSVTAQLCVIKADGTAGFCLAPKKLSTDGKVTFSESDIIATLGSAKLGEGEKFHVTVEGLPQGYTCPDNYYMEKPGEITAVLQAA